MAIDAEKPCNKEAGCKFEKRPNKCKFDNEFVSRKEKAAAAKEEKMEELDEENEKAEEQEAESKIDGGMCGTVKDWPEDVTEQQREAEKKHCGAITSPDECVPTAEPPGMYCKWIYKDKRKA